LVIAVFLPDFAGRSGVIDDGRIMQKAGTCCSDDRHGTLMAMADCELRIVMIITMATTLSGLWPDEAVGASWRHEGRQTPALDGG
jgi:hypothetical protein